MAGRTPHSADVILTVVPCSPADVPKNHLLPLAGDLQPGFPQTQRGLLAWT